MAKHFLAVVVNDDLGDIETEEDLKNFVWDLKDSTYMDLQVKWLFNYDEDAEED